MNNSQTPKVFISHASEDKERFVIDFATKLRANGMDAWVDKWEINIGDSLIEKIFDEGLGECDAFIVILSKHSVNKPWVKEELNTAAIKRINKNTKLIPIIIDSDITVPEVLTSIVWETIENYNSYEIEFQKILASIFGVYEKPKIGRKPTFAINNVEVNGLSKLDSQVLKLIGDLTFKKNNCSINDGDLNIISSTLEITNIELKEVLEILSSEYLIDTQILMGSFYPLISINTYGILRYAEHFLNNYPNLYKDFVALVLNEDLTYSKTYAEKIRCSILLCDALIEDFNNLGYIQSELELTNGRYIYKVTATGKRFFRQFLERGEE